jgi:hypothetical protein
MPNGSAYLWPLLDDALPLFPQIADEVAKGNPGGSIHVNVLLVGDQLVVDEVRQHRRVPSAPPHNIKEVPLELPAEVAHHPPRVLGEQNHHALMGLAVAMAFEAVGVTALFLAHLAVPAQLLKSFRLPQR